MSNRRNFLKNAFAGATGLAAIPAILSASETNVPSRSAKIKLNSLKEGDVVLFQGDSITDFGRNKGNKDPNLQNALGTGYTFLTAAEILNSFPDKDLKIYNRGVGGNKVYQLADRWQADCLDLKPSVLSILIGVNDFWSKLKEKYDGTIEVYEKDYRALLKRTKEALPGVRLVILEPYAVKGGKVINQTWFPGFDSYRAVSRTIAAEFNAIFIPTHSIFEKALEAAPANYWTPDGVHPSTAGAKLISEAWMKYVFGA
jgi:lysophospholipase L1-like esterase